MKRLVQAVGVLTLALICYPGPFGQTICTDEGTTVICRPNPLGQIVCQ